MATAQLEISPLLMQLRQGPQAEPKRGFWSHGCGGLRHGWSGLERLIGALRALAEMADGAPSSPHGF